ncbi:unnamed protein product [Protopolystoma xenopodis]|uniref:Protein-tyrosine sulfotransferase n=1 Tax=Protopolystoma xenopodis TaxID=117903 RepID=A0A448WR91_9PLAT|nr:unnamed protein product [Protopolystoma xenopodis]
MIMCHWTTLMRVLLDVHKHVRCGPESRVIPRILDVRASWNFPIAKKRLVGAGLYPEAVDSATAGFITEIIRLAGRDADRLCNKDPMTFHHLEYMAHLFPKAQFIMMVRDPRAVVASIIKYVVFSLKLFPSLMLTCALETGY